MKKRWKYGRWRIIRGQAGAARYAIYEAFLVKGDGYTSAGSLEEVKRKIDEIEARGHSPQKFRLLPKKGK